MAIGFTMNPDKVKAAAPVAEVLTDEEDLCAQIVRQLRQNHPKAALAAAADLTNLISIKHNLTGGAWT